MSVANCKKCRRVFQQSFSPLCPACHQESVSQISNVYRFIQENPQMTLEDIAEQCLIPFKELEKMFFEGKLGTATNNVIYHCQRCGRSMSAAMRRGRFCMGCAERIESEAGLNTPEKAEKKAPRKVQVAQPRSSSEEDKPLSPSPSLTAMEDEVLFLPPPLTEEPAEPESHGFKRISEQ